MQEYLDTARVPAKAPVNWYGLALPGLDGVESATEPDMWRVCDAVVHTSDRVLIGGGGVGTISALLALKCGNRNVWTAEPNPAMLAFLAGNVAIHQEPLQLIDCALADADGEVPFSLQDFYGNSSLERTDGTPITVKAADTGRLVRELAVTALVLDIEGSEGAILRSLDLTPLRVIVLELHPPADPTAIIQRLVREYRHVSCVINHGKPGFLLAASRQTRL